MGMKRGGWWETFTTINENVNFQKATINISKNIYHKEGEK
jgi:hypothetical protein